MNLRSRTTDWVLLIAVAAFFFLWKLSAFGLIGADEPRYAQVAREMLSRHDWITPTLGGAPWLEKPPLYYWQAILAYKLFGVSDWAARLPSVFDAFLLVLAVYSFFRRIRPQIALDSALVIASTAGVTGFARAASTDMPLAATFTIAMLGWYMWFERHDKKYLLMSYAFLALATLAKGPVAPFLAIAIIAIFAAAKKEVASLDITAWIPGILLFFAIVLPWYVMVQLRNPQFFHDFIVEHNLARFGTNLYHHPEPIWYYLPVSLIGWVPWSAFVVAGIAWYVRRRRKPNADTLLSFLLIWIVVVIVFFSISRSKLPGYILPAIPAGAILAAEFIDKLRQQFVRRTGRIALYSAHAALVGALVFCSLMVQHLVLKHRIPWHEPVLLVEAGVVTAIIFLLLYKAGLRTLRTATLLPTIVALALAVRLGAQGLDDTLSARPVANELAKVDPHHLPLAVFLVPRETEFGLAFYRNQSIPRYELRQIPTDEHLLVAAQGFEKSIAKETGRRPVYLGNFTTQRLEFFYIPGH